jgi:hypothetical protein
MKRDCITSLKRSRKFKLLSATALTMLCITPAFAQNVTPLPRQNIDENGVELASAQFEHAATFLTVGSAEDQLAFSLETGDGRFTNNGYSGKIEATATVATVSYEGSSEAFDLVAGVYTSREGEGTTLTLSGNIYT